MTADNEASDAQYIAEIMFAVGMQIVDAARERYPDFGFTLIVHPPVLRRADHWPLAVATALPNRKQQRALLATVLLRSVQADGVDLDGPEAVFEAMVQADLDALDDPEVQP